MTLLEKTVVFVWIVGLPISYGLFFYWNISRVQKKLSRWSSSRMLYFIGTIGAFGEGQANRLKMMDGEGGDVKSSDIVTFQKYQRIFFLELIAVTIVLSLVLTCALKFVHE